jgi:hypothetical protein
MNPLHYQVVSIEKRVFIRHWHFFSSVIRALSLLAFCLWLFVPQANAQDVQTYMSPTDAPPGNFGLKIGGNLASHNNSNDIYKKTLPGFQVLLYYTEGNLAGKHIELTQEFGWVSKGWSSKTPDPEWPETFLNASYGLGYLELNNIVKAKLFEKGTTPFVFGGFYLSALLAGQDDLTSIKSDGIVNTIDYGPSFGFGIDFGGPNYGEKDRWGGLDIRYSMGLNEIIKGIDLKNRTLSVVFRLYLFEI